MIMSGACLWVGGYECVHVHMIVHVYAHACRD